MTLGTIFLSETVGSAFLILLGCGVVANNLLSKTKGHASGTLHINWGWGIAVFAGVMVSYASGAHLNFAVTMGVVASGARNRSGYSVDAASIFTYLAGQMVGSIIGAVLAWLAYKKHFDEDAPEGFKLGVFSTGPEIRSYGWNLITEIIGTFVLVLRDHGARPLATIAVTSGSARLARSALGVGMLIVGIGASLGGPTGYAINPELVTSAPALRTPSSRSPRARATSDWALLLGSGGRPDHRWCDCRSAGSGVAAA